MYPGPEEPAVPAPTAQHFAPVNAPRPDEPVAIPEGFRKSHSMHSNTFDNSDALYEKRNLMALSAATS
jgi:hypothetical protein